ncbi:DUF2971 domain-containing protein [Anaerorhabdus furcosa]|uniref:DUF2971 domain-containing protein n=1 Tax=Anaerorhabdus furcosa TaxID=118967 RepID=A0A1T4LDA6_9FIRM|nr:DUF2971 domain-containing protein [Anaerorhabdus furcosa]SJZ52695.1 Protein of unknown function [Anaerorhabdus furcosa]
MKNINTETVYHYTSPEGVYQILKSKSLRFTDCQYLNDSGEISYIERLFKEEYCRILRNRSEEISIPKFVNQIFQSRFGEDRLFFGENKNGDNEFSIKKYRYYVLCASSDFDSSSMWSYYIKNNSYYGYNLGIEIATLKKCFENSSQNLDIELLSDKVVYDELEQRKIIFNKLNELFQNLDKSTELLDENKEDRRLINDFVEGIEEFINIKKLFFKNPAFSSEKEYRFVLKIPEKFDGNNCFNLDYRVGKSGIITPFITWFFGLNEKELMFKQITFAPMIEIVLARESFRRFLATSVYENIKFVNSSMNVRF